MEMISFSIGCFFKKISRELFPFLFIVSIAGLTIFLYRFGWSGGWHFDDWPNLGGLTYVFSQGQIDAEAVLEFVFSGDAGPLGRPVALASFLIDGSGWPAHPIEILRTNTLLHAINGLLLWAVLFNLGHLRNWPQTKAAWLAALGAGFWLLLPLSASGVLMAVQRMTVLSSSFMLLGLWLYLLGRAHLGKPSLHAWLWMAGGLGLGTLLGVLTKEQAGILPLLAWVLESCWLTPPQFITTAQRRSWLGFKVLFFYLPAATIGVYLLHIVWTADSAYAVREFTLSERLWTEAVVLWDYLRLAFVPRAMAFGPFHDDYPIFTASSLPALVAASGWLGACILAFALRRSTRLPLLALLWFAVTHLVESSVVPLELYFEHRNYLALALPLFALLVAMWHWAEKRHTERLVALVLGSYGVLLAGVLFQTTTLFGGQPLATAQIWYRQHPGSIRAGQYLGQHQSQMNQIESALEVLDATAQLRPNAGALSLQGLQLACVLGKPMAELQARRDQVLRELPLAPQRFSIVDTLDKLKTLYIQKDCGGFIQQDDLLTIAQAALNNPRIAGIAQERSNLHVFMASLFIDAKQLGPTMEHLLAALQAVPSLQNLQLTAVVLKSAGIGDEMAEILEQHTPQWPRNPWLRQRMQKEWQELQTQVRALK